MLATLIDSYFHCVLRRPAITLSVVVLLVLTAASQLPHLKIDASADALTLEYDQDLDYFREISKRYQASDFLVVTYTPKGDLFDPDTLRHLTALRDDLLAVGGVSSANSILDVPLLYSPPVSLLEVTRGLQSLSDKVADNDVDFAQVKQEFLASPLYKDMLLGPDGKTTAILLNLASDDHYISLVRERDGLRMKRDETGLSPAENLRLEAVTEEFLALRTLSAEKSHQRVKEVRGIVGQYGSEATIFLGGVSMITADMVDFIRSDIVVFGSGIIIFLVAMLSIIFRQWQFVVLPLVTCLLSLVLMLGFLAGIDWRLTVISSNFVALLLIICLAITIHLIVRFREYSGQRPQASRTDKLRATVQVMFHPCLYTLLTTLVAFVSLVVSGIRPVIDFGWMMVIGMGITFVMAFIVIPAGLMILPATNNHYTGDNTAAFTLKFSRFTEKFGGLILVAGIVAAITSVIGIRQLEVENRFIDYFHPSTEIHQGMLVIDQQLGGTATLDIILRQGATPVSDKEPIAVASDEFSGEDSADPFAAPAAGTGDAAGDEFALGDPFADDDPFSDADPFANGGETGVKPVSSYWFTQGGLEKIQQVHEYLESLSQVGKVQSLAMAYQVIGDLNQRAPNDFELALVRQALTDDIAGVLIDPYLNDELRETRLTMRVRETDPNLQRAELLAKIKTTLTDDFGFAPEEVQLTGVLVLYNNMLQSLFRSQILTLGAVFIGIMLMFLVLFRSLWLSLIALTPNLLAASVVLGGMGLVGIPLDMMTITIAAIAVGIGVDDAIHYIYRFRHEFSREKNYRAAMHNSHASIGQAMYYTSVTVIVGFSILALSKFIPSIYFGLLTGLAMLAAIVASLTLLPKLMLVIKPLGKEL